MREAGYVTIRHFFEPSEALFLKSVLEGHGITAFVTGEHAGGLSPAFSLLGGGVQGGIKLQVFCADADEARAILDGPGE